MNGKVWICLLLSVHICGMASYGQVVSEIQEVVNLRDSVVQQVLLDEALKMDDWDILPEIRFWRQAMNLTGDSCILNIADTRETLLIFPTIWYDTLPESKKVAFKDSMIQRLELPESTRLYITYGKREYYQFDEILGDVDRGISVFEREAVDPWYAQTILLIESPGFNRVSINGARGRFQLMKYVAIKEGLTVNADLDERDDFDKSAQAAAKYIKRVCIPEARRLMAKRGIAVYEKDLWFRLLVMHIYHAGGRNVSGALSQIPRSYRGMKLIQKLWHTRYRGFQNASQNYSQIAVAALLELQELVSKTCDLYCLNLVPPSVGASAKT
ncbi:MAG: hypothetical protein AAFR59_11935 [Bacteroidota bacterium]